MNILIADDHQIVRDGLKNILHSEIDLHVIAEASNGREAIKLASQLRPDLVIIDIAMPELNGIEATKQIIREMPDVKIIALSMHSDKIFIQGMFKAGASGYLLKNCAQQELIEAIRTVEINRKYISRDISDVLIGDYVDSLSSSKENETSELSDREREILQLIVEGHSTREVADKLFISHKTVESHRKNIMEKLNIFNLPELTKYAIRTGLISLD